MAEARKDEIAVESSSTVTSFTNPKPEIIHSKVRTDNVMVKSEAGMGKPMPTQSI